LAIRFPIAATSGSTTGAATGNPSSTPADSFGSYTGHSSIVMAALEVGFGRPAVSGP